MRQEELEDKVKQIKLKTAQMCIEKQKGHISSALSCAEIMVVLYYEILQVDPRNPGWKERDRFVMSKNHGSVITYPILADLGFFPESALDTYQEDGSIFGTHSKLPVPGVEFAGGSLGIGLGAACGMALAARADGASWRTYCLVGDCECEEGSIWESIMFAGHNRLSNLIMLIDCNGEGCTDFIDELVPLAPWREKLEAFGWEVREVQNGHSVKELMGALFYADQEGRTKPLCFVIHTVKGNGISSMLHKPWLHGQVPGGEDGVRALAELGGKKNAVK